MAVVGRMCCTVRDKFEPQAHLHVGLCPSLLTVIPLSPAVNELIHRVFSSPAEIVVVEIH